MANSNPPVKGQTFTIRVGLNDMTIVGSFKANPTIASGDFKVDIDGAGYNNLGTQPSVSPAASTDVLITVDGATEMTGDVVTVTGIDQTSPKEWADFKLCIKTTLAQRFGVGVSG